MRPFMEREETEMGDGIKSEANNNEEQYPTDKFHNTLNEIANHKFVTEDTREYRKGMEEWMADLRDGFQELGVSECVFVPTGSVAVGMVSKEAGSDIDGKVLYRLPNNSEAVDRFIRKVGLPEKFNPFLIFSETTSMIERTEKDSKLALELNNDRMIDDQAKLFAPSLSEFTNPDERKTVDSWRKEIIQKLSDLPNNQSEAVWNLMRHVLERQFVMYENSVGGDTEKRKTRVENIISNGLDSIYGADEKRKSIANAVIAGRRETFHYPDFSEMKEIFLGKK